MQSRSQQSSTAKSSSSAASTAANSNAPYSATTTPNLRPVRNSSLARFLRLRRQISSQQSQTIVPPISPYQTREIQRLAIAAIRRRMRRHAASIFFLKLHRQILYQRDQHYSRIHLHQHVSEMWEASGLPFSALIDRLIELALERHRGRRSLRYSAELMPLFAFLLSSPRRLRTTRGKLARDLKKMIDVFNIADREAADPVSPDRLFIRARSRAC